MVYLCYRRKGEWMCEEEGGDLQEGERLAKALVQVDTRPFIAFYTDGKWKGLAGDQHRGCVIIKVGEGDPQTFKVKEDLVSFAKTIKAGEVVLFAAVEVKWIAEAIQEMTPLGLAPLELGAENAGPLYVAAGLAGKGQWKNHSASSVSAQAMCVYPVRDANE